MKMRVPNMAGGGAAFQAQMARMQQQMMQSAAQQQQAAAEHTGTVARQKVLKYDVNFRKNGKKCGFWSILNDIKIKHASKI